MEWGEEAFQRAEREDKPILLSISALWCHWCHVMDKTTYSDPKVIELVENNFIPVRVNTDMRPDINDRYNMGGWPSTAFLTPSGEIITGGTYIAPDLMVRVLNQVAAFYGKKKDEINSEIKAKKEKLKNLLIPDSADMRPIMTDVEDIIVINFDREFGGFGTEPKFPQIDVLLYALRQGFIHDDRELLDIVEISLDKMANSKTYDRIEGAFFRYATRRDWTEPHYEKMLEDNANFIRLYTEAYQVFRRESYKLIAQEIINFLSNIMYNKEQNYFYGSVDADEKYYSADREERKKMLYPSIDRTLYTNWNAEASDAFIYAGSIFEEQEIVNTGFAVLNTLKDKCLDEDGSTFHYVNNQRGLKMALYDVSSILRSFLNAYFLTGNRDYINSFSKILEKSVEVLWDEEKGGFFDIVEDKDSFGELKQRQKNFILNSKMAEILSLFSNITEDEKWRKMAEEIIDLFAGVYKNYSIFAVSYASAYYFTKSPALRLNVVGKMDDGETKKLLRESYRFYYPGKSVVLLEPDKDFQVLKSLGFNLEFYPAIYPCEGRRCFKPFADLSGFKNLLAELKG